MRGVFRALNAHCNGIVQISASLRDTLIDIVANLSRWTRHRDRSIARFEFADFN